MADEQRYWGVTTLLNAGLPKPNLIGWAARTVAEYAVDEREAWELLAQRDRAAAIKLLVDARWRTTGKAMARGTDVHEFAEARALGKEPQVREEIAPWAKQIDAFLTAHKPKYLLAEAPVYNLTLGYAGTLDAVVEIGGKTCLMDIKTTDKGPDARSRPPYDDIALQLVAYARAEKVGLDPAQQRKYGGRRYYIWDDDRPSEVMPKVDGALALVISPFDYQLVPVLIDNEVWKAFLSVREVARWSIDLSRRVLGPCVAA